VSPQILKEETAVKATAAQTSGFEQAGEAAAAFLAIGF